MNNSAQSPLRQHAFTLIELLVVSAIIAILAAILFPVFAQAKSAAKGTASLSNLKQISLSAHIYAGDYDDRTVPATVWNSGNDPIETGTGQTNASWVWLLQPYQKNVDLVIDPLGPPALRFDGIPQAVTNSVRMSYGINQLYLSYWDSTGAPSRTVSLSSISSPSATVYFTSRTHPSEYNIGLFNETPFSNIYYFFQYGHPTNDQGPNLAVTVDAPAYDAPEYRIANPWGDRGDYWISTFEQGRYTGGVSFRRAKKAIVTMTDGHVKSMTAGQLSAGTDFDLAKEMAGVNMPLPRITKREDYLWDLQ